jgi:hypothetical protein
MRSRRCLCVSVYPPIVVRPGKNPLTVARQRLFKKRYRGNEYTRNRRIVGGVVFNVARVVSRKVAD